MIPLFIPYVNRPDLLERAVASIPAVNGIEVVVINNSGGMLESGAFKILTPPSPRTFTETQNLMLNLAKMQDAPFYFFMHSDAEAGNGTVCRLFEMARLENRNWGVIFTSFDALAAFNTAAFNEVCGWDERFTWYHSDTDIYRRLRLAGYELLESNLPVHHEPSQTLKADPEISRKVAEGFAERVRLYAEKWGGPAGSEKFLTPFNRS